MSISPESGTENVNFVNETTISGTQQSKDHTVSHRHRLSLQNYPEDCPPLSVRWFHAIDVPKRKATYGPNPNIDSKPLGPPKKYLAFSVKDSRAIEAAFQTISAEGERTERKTLSGDDGAEDVGEVASSQGGGTSMDRQTLPEEATLGTKVAVNEDYLFDVDIPKRELGPAYWLGPIYDVRRGSWFFQDGSSLKPCEENLAIQLEEGYIKNKPWKIQSQYQRSASQPRPPLESLGPHSIDDGTTSANSNPVTRRTSIDSLSDKSVIDDASVRERPKELKISHAPLTHRLFGPYTKSLVTFQDASTAWIVEDSMLSRMTGTVYERFAGGAHYSGTKVVRGYLEPSSKKKPAKDFKVTNSLGGDLQRPSRSVKRQSFPASALNDVETSPKRDLSASEDPNIQPSPGRHVRTLERQLSSIATQDPEEQEEEARQREMQEIRDDYREVEGDEQDRHVEHLVLITHGIGQRLGARFESFNFIHDVNELRKTLKAVYASSEDLQALNAEIDVLPKNCRIQVLPICWRHKLDFPMASVKSSRKELDLGDLDATENQTYPSLDDITIEGVAALRNIVADLALDVLLYQTPVYRDHISKIVAKECNNIYNLFRRRNPTFNGKVSLIGHSLGSAIMFDILSDQPQEQAIYEKRFKNQRAEELDLKLDFEVENFFCFGSPLGLFQMLGGRTIAGRINPNKVTLDGEVDSISDPFEGSSYSTMPQKNPPATTHHDDAVSSPKCKQLYNIFHPSDPISYRLEPLVSPAMASLKPQLLPYTKKGIFGAPMGQGLTGIPARVGQGFSGLWSSFSTGIATSLLNKSLGISAEDAARMSLPTHQENKIVNQSVGAGTNIAGGVIPSERLTADKSANILKSTQGITSGGENTEHPPTLIDGEIETLWGGFQKRKKSLQASDTSHFGDSSIWDSADERGRKLRKEEAKVRALNSTGRIDFSIQEGAFDISFIASIASHLSYWQDEDVAHFMTSQMLSLQRLVKTNQSLVNSRF